MEEIMETIEHSYICGRCGGGGELHYVSLPENEEAPDTYEFHFDDAEHDPDCASDDRERMANEPLSGTPYQADLVADEPPTGEDGTR